MLEEYKKQCQISATTYIPNWRDLSTYQLANLYLQSQDEGIKSGCFSALMFRYWRLISKAYNQCKAIATIEDCYDWLVETLLYVLDKHVWTDPNSDMYKKENAPERAIMTFFSSYQVNYYVASTRQKRKLNTNLLSLDKIQEETNLDAYVDDNQDSIATVKTLINQAFKKRKYFLAFMVDKIITSEIFKSESIDDRSYIKLSRGKLAKELSNIDDTYLKEFSDTYDINYTDVCFGYDMIKNLTASQMTTKIKQNLSLLREWMT